jgi:hypothetical protein
VSVTQDLLGRVAERFEFADDGCWSWTAWRDKHGYGRVSVGSVRKLAHRVVYELCVGPIPGGLELDHLCRNRACINPDHLEPVTHHENLMRGDGVSARNARKTHCPRGHALSGNNLYVDPKGDRECRTCRRILRRICYDRTKAAA